MSSTPEDSNEPLIRVMALHALMYCERLFYLEEVEEIRIADASIYAGRRLHEELAADEGEMVSLVLESEKLGIKGKVDCLRRRNGQLIPYEHKRGRCRKGEEGPEAWPSDRLQVCAYTLLLEENTGTSIDEARIRYHGDNATVRVAIDEAARETSSSRFVIPLFCAHLGGHLKTGHSWTGQNRPPRVGSETGGCEYSPPFPLD